MDVVIHLLTHGPVMSGSHGTWRTWPGSWTPVYPVISAVWPPEITVFYPARPEGKSILPGSLFLLLWPVRAAPVALHTDPSVDHMRKRVQ